ncbi:hypothetical protein [Grimontia marina]|uniref:Uncharacterized protein n=1 Tax=Grimontia marina TaxID=646534 RepID=A0A128FG88_9GAMM|nr:hypothetical protein [Grimontia marina]CZF85813.1 hypothetical protein GMA8713_03846 [Grimontia marina]
MKNKKPLFSLLPLAFFCQGSLAKNVFEDSHNLQKVTPICVHPNQQRFISLEGEDKTLNIGFHSLINLNNETKYGIDYTEIDDSQYNLWSVKCPDEYLLEAYLPTVDTRTIFKVIDKKEGMQFAPGVSVNRIKNGSSNEYEILSLAYDVLRKLAVNRVDEDVRRFLEDGNNHYTINLTTLQDEKGSFVDFQEKRIQINLLELGMPYLNINQLESEFTLQRLITHEIVHASAEPGTSEEDVIRRTNLLLSDCEYNDEPRMPVSGSDNNNSRYAFVQASAPPTPSQRFNAFFNRPTKEFVSDPFMWLSAIFSAPSFAGVSMSISRIATRAAMPRIPYQPIGRTNILPRTNSVSSINSLSSSIASSYSSSIETASIETLSSSSSVETASIETLSSNTELDGLGDGPMSLKEQQAFVNKVDEDLEALSIEPHKKISIQFKLSPTAHYLNQAPDIARQFLRGEITVMELYNQMPL